MPEPLVSVLAWGKKKPALSCPAALLQNPCPYTASHILRLVKEAFGALYTLAAVFCPVRFKQAFALLCTLVSLLIKRRAEICGGGVGSAAPQRCGEASVLWS